MIERANKSKSAVSVLLEDVNEIDVYIEDTAKESKKIYTELINNVFKNKYKIESIIPLGPSSKVIKEWKKHQENNNNRKKVFLIDGDYHVLNETSIMKEIKENKGLFILPRYCIENYLIDFNALTEIVHEETEEETREEIINKLNFNLWKKDNQELKKLFIYNSICQEFNVGIKTSKYKYSNLTTDNTGLCCNNLISERINYLKQSIIEKSSDINISEEYDKRFNRVSDIDILSIVSGKDYLMPLIKKHISSKYNNCLSMSNISLKIRISKICNIDELKPIENELH